MVYLRARYFDPSVGRFITQDPFSGYADYPQTQNPYLYAGNNPIRFTDPSGECFDPVTGAMCIGALFGGGIDLYMQLHNNGGRWDCINWGEVAISAGAGAIAGLVGFYAFTTLLPTTIATATLSDFVIAGGLSSIVAGQAARSSALLFSGRPDLILNSFAQPDDVLNDFALGAVFGGLRFGIKTLIGSVRNAINEALAQEYLTAIHEDLANQINNAVAKFGSKSAEAQVLRDQLALFATDNYKSGTVSLGGYKINPNYLDVGKANGYTTYNLLGKSY